MADYLPSLSMLFVGCACVLAVVAFVWGFLSPTFEGSRRALFVLTLVMSIVGPIVLLRALRVPPRIAGWLFAGQAVIITLMLCTAVSLMLRRPTSNTLSRAR